MFKSTNELSKLSSTDPAFPTVKELVYRLITAYTPPDHTFNAEDYGYVIQIQEGHTDCTLDEIWDGSPCEAFAV